MLLEISPKDVAVDSVEKVTLDMKEGDFANKARNCPSNYNQLIYNSAVLDESVVDTTEERSPIHNTRGEC